VTPAPALESERVRGCRSVERSTLPSDSRTVPHRTAERPAPAGEGYGSQPPKQKTGSVKTITPSSKPANVDPSNPAEYVPATTQRGLSHRIPARYAGSADACSSRFGRIRVYDPDPGFVTGGGWINSMAGAYAPDPSIVGKATFVVAAKYKNAAPVPSGHIEFRFRDAGLTFRSEDLLWLLVSYDASRFWLRGAGTINGQMSPGGVPYELMVYAEEGNPDTVRFWIFGTDEGGLPYRVYYNGVTQQPLDGGDFLIHTNGK